MVKELACRKCKRITTLKVCQDKRCRSSDLTPYWEGIVIVANPEESRIAKTLKITAKGKYALKVT